MTAGNKLRILITTVGGVDCPNICNVIHYGSPATVERLGELDEMEVFSLLYCMGSLESMWNSQ